MQKFSNVKKSKNNININNNYINISDERITFARMYSVVMQHAIFGIINLFILYIEPL